MEYVTNEMSLLPSVFRKDVCFYKVEKLKLGETRSCNFAIWLLWLICAVLL